MLESGRGEGRGGELCVLESVLCFELCWSGMEVIIGCTLCMDVRLLGPPKC